MMKVGFWIFLLILVYLLISYYKGTTGLINVFGSFFDQTVLFLQGRKADGTVGSYPTNGG